MKKKFFKTMLVCLGILGSCYTTTFAMEKADVDLYYLGRNAKLDNAIYVEDDIYFIPLRECAEQIGYTVDYTPSVITLTDKFGKKIEYRLDMNTIFVHGKPAGIFNIKNINGISYVNLNAFYDLMSIDIREIQNNGKKTLRISSNSKTFKKNNFNNSISLLNVVEKNKNGVISPISMKMSLAMIANGTTGQTQQEILNTLGYSNIEQCNQFVSEALNWKVEERRSDYGNLNDNQGSIYFANSLWYNNNTQNTKDTIFNENFNNRIQSVFKGVANVVTPDTAVTIINKWIEQQTNGMLKNMISDANFQTALINTTYFKCSWEEEFKNENTKKDIFYNIDNTQSETDFINGTPNSEPYYCEANGWQMLGLPYSYKKYTMYLFLPEKGKELTLDNDTINTLLSFQERLKVKITMPKFTTEEQYDFKDTLKAMGINAMFQNDNDFCDMYTEGNQICISDVLQKTKIIVNEQGTEAASGTVSASRGMNMDEPAVFRADRPFIYMITAHHYDTEEVLFIGQYVTAKQ